MPKLKYPTIVPYKLRSNKDFKLDKQFQTFLTAAKFAE